MYLIGFKLHNMYYCLVQVLLSSTRVDKPQSQFTLSRSARYRPISELELTEATDGSAIFHVYGYHLDTSENGRPC